MNNRDIILLSIFTLLTVLLWMGFEAIHASQKSTITPQVNQQIKPITPSFDNKLLKQIKNRQTP